MISKHSFFSIRILALCSVMSLGLLVACGDDDPIPEPEPPSTAPVLGAITLNCVQAPASTRYPYDHNVIQSVSVQVTDEEQDLLTEEVRGSVNGFAIARFQDDDGDEVFEWVPPAGLKEIPCRGDVFVRVEALDLDDNYATKDEQIAK